MRVILRGRAHCLSKRHDSLRKKSFQTSISTSTRDTTRIRRVSASYALFPIPFATLPPPIIAATSSLTKLCRQIARVRAATLYRYDNPESS